MRKMAADTKLLGAIIRELVPEWAPPSRALKVDRDAGLISYRGSSLASVDASKEGPGASQITWDPELLDILQQLDKPKVLEVFHRRRDERGPKRRDKIRWCI